MELKPLELDAIIADNDSLSAAYVYDNRNNIYREMPSSLLYQHALANNICFVGISRDKLVCDCSVAEIAHIERYKCNPAYLQSGLPITKLPGLVIPESDFRLCKDKSDYLAGISHYCKGNVHFTLFGRLDALTKMCHILKVYYPLAHRTALLNSGVNRLEFTISEKYVRRLLHCVEGPKMLVQAPTEAPEALQKVFQIETIVARPDIVELDACAF